MSSANRRRDFSHSLWLYLHALWSDLIARLSGIASVILTAIGASTRAGLPRWTFWIAAVFCLIVASFRVWHKQYQITEAASAIRIRLEDGWYDLHGPDAAHAEVAIHFRLRLNIENPNDRNTTISFVDLSVPGQDTLKLGAIRFFPEGRPVAHLTRTVDLTSGQTMISILEVDLSIPNQALGVWGQNVAIELSFSETYSGKLEPLTTTVPHTP